MAEKDEPKVKDPDEVFREFLADVRNGQALHDWGEELSAVVAAVKETGKAGKLQITFDVKPADDGHQLIFADKYKATIPKPPVPKTYLYRMKDGSLSRRDPRQPDLPGLREVEGGKKADGKNNVVNLKSPHGGE